jgi:hypothetical protein
LEDNEMKGGGKLLGKGMGIKAEACGAAWPAVAGVRKRLERRKT